MNMISYSFPVPVYCIQSSVFTEETRTVRKLVLAISPLCVQMMYSSNFHDGRSVRSSDFFQNVAQGTIQIIEMDACCKG